MNGEATIVTVADGRHAMLRLLRPDDAPAVLAAIDEADPADLRRRFMGCPPPASFLVKRLNVIDESHHVGLGAFEGQRIVGIAQFDRADETPSAEIAIAVATDWQHSGLGTQMLLHLAEIARGRGIHHFTARFFADNMGIRHLLSDIDRGVHLRFEKGEGFADIDLEHTEALEVTCDR